MSRKSEGKTVLKQIAEKAGVSVSTVSIVLNGRGDEMRISSATQDRVRECAKDADYTPNVYARKLRKSADSGNTKIVGVFWSTDFLDESMGEFFQNAHQTILEKNYSFEFSIHFFTPCHLNEIKDQLVPWQFNSILFCGARKEDVDFLESLHLDIPIVVSNNSQAETLSSVYVDNIDVGKRSARTLFDHGYKSAGIITQHRLTSGASIRRFGFTSEAEHLGMTIRPEWCASVDFSDLNATREAVTRILSGSEKPDSLYVVSYHNAISIIMAVNDLAQGSDENSCALMICGQNPMLNVLAQNACFVNLGIGIYARQGLEMLQLLMDGSLNGPVKWVITPKIDDDKLKMFDKG